MTWGNAVLTDVDCHFESFTMLNGETVCFRLEDYDMDLLLDVEGTVWNP